MGNKAGDWIKCDYTVTGWPSGTPYPKWLKVEIQSVEGTMATVEVTMHMSDGTEQNQTMTVDIMAGERTLGIFSGFVIPADRTTGDSIHISGYGNLTIAGETTRTYAGASRKVVYTSFTQYCMHASIGNFQPPANLKYDQTDSISANGLVQTKDVNER